MAGCSLGWESVSFPDERWKRSRGRWVQGVEIKRSNLAEIRRFFRREIAFIFIAFEMKIFFRSRLTPGYFI
jgi:hypothetical protein